MERNLKLRTITGVVYVVVLVLFFALKLFISNLCFDALILFFTAVGTYEMIRAFRDKLHLSQKIVIMVFALLVVLAYTIADFIFVQIYEIKLPGEEGFENAVGRNYAPHILLVAFLAGLAILFGLMVFKHEQVTLESTGYALIAYLYPSVFLVVLSICNHLEKYSDLALVLVFVISPIADCFAFLFGRTLGKKLPAKLAPHISPNKTLIGGAGGLLGGAIGGVLVFFFNFGVCQPIQPMLDALKAGEPFVWTVNFEWWELIFFCSIGVVVSAFSQFGDLVESAIKRHLDIKDMGKILPGHGGVLDRIDSSLYASLIVALILVVRIMTTG